MLTFYGLTLYYTWNKSADMHYNDGYEAACIDVATGKIEVKLADPNEE